MTGPLRRPLLLFLVLCALVLLYTGLNLHRWGQGHSRRIADLRDDLGSPRKSSLIGKLRPDANATRQAAAESPLVAAAREDLRGVEAGSMRVVAIRIDEKDLLDPETGLKANSRERGRAWERPAGVVVMREGRELLAAPAGLRLQGNRDTRDMLHSFRLYFRNSYGMKDVPGETFLDDSGMDIRKVLARKEKNLRPGFVSMLAFDTARRLGSITPDFAPALMLRNGQNLGLALASEHVNRTHWERKLGHKDFDFYVFESENSVLDDARYKSLRLRLNPFFGLWDYDRVASIMDLDDFENAMICFAFLQWQDWNQGALIQDRTEPEPRWRSVLWDADLAFAGLRPNGVPKNKGGWRNLSDVHGMRAALFKGLWTESPRFRDELLQRLSWSVNHRLTGEWIEERVGHYARLEKEAGFECFDEATALAYLLERRRGVLAETVADLGAPAVVACRVQSPEALRIDGAQTPGMYEGFYFKGQKAILEPGPATGFSHWVIDGREVHEPRIELALHQDTAIRAVFLPAPQTP